MTNKDWMVGDWCTDETGKITVVKPSDLVDNDTAGRLHPIKLTEEILSYNGFEQLEKSPAWEYDSHMTDDDYIGFRCFQIANGFVLQTDFRTISISNIHQLQHALRLCGVRKDIIVERTRI